MATCPKCLGSLTENHRCPRTGRLSRILETSVALAAGGAAGVALCFAFASRPTGSLLLSSAALGAVLVQAFYDAVRMK